MNLKVNAKLDPKFAPMSVVCRDMREATKENGHIGLVLECIRYYQVLLD